MVLIRRYKQKKLISKISDDSNFIFSSYAWLCVFHCSHRLLCWINSRVREFSVKIALISYWNASSHIPLGGVCFLEESYRKYTAIFKCSKIFRASSISNISEYACTQTVTQLGRKMIDYPTPAVLVLVVVQSYSIFPDMAWTRVGGKKVTFIFMTPYSVPRMGGSADWQTWITLPLRQECDNF